MSHLSGKNFDVMLGDTLIHIESMSATITDNRQAVKTGGVPDGYVDGDVSCSGELEVTSKTLNRIIEQAKSAGSFRDLPPFDIITNGTFMDEKQKMALYGCLLKISDLLNLNPNGGEKTMHKIGYDVTSPDFVRINDVPYLSESDVAGL
jgi:hypothetical protein